MLTRGEGVTVKRFGGEGTRGRSYLTYGWKVGHTYQLKVNARSDANESDKVVFTGWFLIPELNIWRLLAPFQVRPTAARKKLENLHRFLKIGLELATAVRTCVVQQGSGQTVVLGFKLHTEEAQPESDTKNRNGFLSDNRKHLGITTGRPALSDKSLGPYRCSSSSIPSVLRLNSPAGCDGARARES